MKATQRLHDLGQSLWLDHITRELLSSGTLQRYIDELSVTGLTSNPTIFDQAISKSPAYDDDIRGLVSRGLVRRGSLFRIGPEGPETGGAPFCSHTPAHRGGGWLGLFGSIAAVGL